MAAINTTVLLIFTAIVVEDMAGGANCNASIRLDTPVSPLMQRRRRMKLLRRHVARLARRLSTEAIKASTGAGPPTIGTVVRADGTPAVAVGVQPIACASSHSVPQGMDIFVTTTAAGGFAFVPYDPLCGLRILLGATTHEVELQYPVSPSLPSLLIRLPPAGCEQHGIFDWRREYGDPRGAWLRGRVVRDGVPAADVDIAAVVLPRGYSWLYDETRSRADGSFELFISAEKLDGYRVVDLFARKTLTDLSGRQLVRVMPGESRNDLVLEIGAGVTVTGTVVDENGLPIAAARVAAESYSDRWASEPSGPDGSFRLTVGPQGRYRLRAIASDRIERKPLPGKVLPKIDIAKPSGVQTGVRLVVSRNQHRDSRAFAEPGYVDLGVETSYRVVTAVGDELEAAGLKVGDEIVSAQLAGSDLKEWQLPEGRGCGVGTGRRSHRQTRQRNDLRAHDCAAVWLTGSLARASSTPPVGLLQPALRAWSTLARFRGLRGERRDEPKRLSNPRRDRGTSAGSGGPDEDEASEWAPGEVHWPHVLLCERCCMSVRSYAHHQVVARDTDEHLAVEQKRDTAEHLLLGDVRCCWQDAPDSFSELFVVRHVLRFSRRRIRERICAAS
jgi:hypothetical protein